MNRKFFLVPLIAALAIVAGSRSGSAPVDASPSYAKLLAQGQSRLAMSEAEVAGATTEEAAIIWNPLSASLTSGCALSGCLGSACTQSGCFGSVCIVSGCAGSLCELSGCAGSVCIGSLCVGSVCAGSGCVGSVCAGRCAVEVEGTVEVGAATTSQTAAAGWWERVDVAAGD